MLICICGCICGGCGYKDCERQNTPAGPGVQVNGTAPPDTPDAQLNGNAPFDTVVRAGPTELPVTLDDVVTHGADVVFAGWLNADEGEEEVVAGAAETPARLLPDAPAFDLAMVRF